MEDLKELFKVTITEGVLLTTGDYAHVIRVKDVVHGKIQQTILLNLVYRNCDIDDVIQSEVSLLIEKLKNDES